jgi:putative component of toxin-antitoxin plasmid stabilization module
MYKIKRTDEFSNWLDGLKDPITKQRLVGRLRKAMNGNFPLNQDSCRLKYFY